MDIKLFTARDNMILAFENQFRASTVERALLIDSLGRIVVERKGDSSQVKFSSRELEAACIGTLTHVHPKCKPPSKNDLITAARYGLLLRAVGITPEGEHIDYTVKMASPSEKMATQINRQYDSEIEKAEIELAKREWNDQKWEREARHLAVTRLAEKLGFMYERQIKVVPIAEMRETSQEERRLDLLSNVARVIGQEVFQTALHQIERSLIRNMNSKSVIPVERMQSVRHEAELVITYAMLGKPAQNGAFSPYKVHSGGHIVPDSPYFAVLWGLIRQAAKIAANYHAAMMRKHLPDDVQKHFELATINPFSSSVSEMDDDNLPKLVYDPLRRWIDGKALSDRIWIATGDMRAKLDEYLTAAISMGKSVHQMTADLQEFLVTGNGTYEAMRLARTEVAAAYSLADFTAAQLNPLVETYSPYTVPQHQCCDNCDIEEAGGPYLKNDPRHLPPFHPLCICSIRWNQTERAGSIIERLRKQILVGLSATRRSVADLVGPLSKRFIDFMFGERK